MKVTFTKEMKEVITIAQATAVKKVIECMKEDTGLKDYAKSAVSYAKAYGEILKVEAEIAKNRRVWDRYDEGTEDIDVWLKIKAFDGCLNFYDIGVYLSDLWDISNDNSDEIKEKMYIATYKFTK